MKEILQILEKLDHKIDLLGKSLNSKWLTVGESAIYCRISQSKMRKLIGAGKIPINRIDGKILLNRRELDYLILTGSARPTKRQREAVECLL